jgi:hypothetical protein
MTNVMFLDKTIAENKVYVITDKWKNQKLLKSWVINKSLILQMLFIMWWHLREMERFTVKVEMNGDYWEMETEIVTQINQKLMNI